MHAKKFHKLQNNNISFDQAAIYTPCQPMKAKKQEILPDFLQKLLLVNRVFQRVCL
jgi:hypothetical protein